MEINELKQLIEYAFTDTSNRLMTLKFYKLSEQQVNDLENISGINFENFHRTIDNYAIIHTHKNHGDNQKEALRGQIAIIKDDYLLIPDIVATFDYISWGKKSPLGNELLQYEKVIGDFVFFYVEEVRRKRKTLAMKTLYKRKASTFIEA